mgnify:CR=1 FL=1
MSTAYILYIVYGRSVLYAFVCYSKSLLLFFSFVFCLMIRRPPRSTLDRSSAASDVYKRQDIHIEREKNDARLRLRLDGVLQDVDFFDGDLYNLSFIHISEPTRPY